MNNIQDLEVFIGKDNFEFYPNFFSQEHNEKLFLYCKYNINWNQHYIHFSEKTVTVPRLVKWFGNMTYKYSGITNDPCIMDPIIVKVMNKINSTITFANPLNSCLLNYYRSGKDSISLHKDDERELGSHPVIAVVSLGNMREFIIQRSSDKQKIKVPLQN